MLGTLKKETPIWVECVDFPITFSRNSNIFLFAPQYSQTQNYANWSLSSSINHSRLPVIHALPFLTLLWKWKSRNQNEFARPNFFTQNNHFNVMFKCNSLAGQPAWENESAWRLTYANCFSSKKLHIDKRVSIIIKITMSCKTFL